MENDTDTNAFYICQDCAMWHANGELPDMADDDTVAAITGVSEHFAVDCGENAEHCLTFSWSRCDACGSSLGGDRHRAFIV